MTALELRDLSPGDLDDLIRIRIRSFGPMPEDRDQWRREAMEFVEAGRYLGVYADGELVAGARIWDFGQWWHGRLVPMAGIASVVVAPEYRGRGAATLIMRGVMARSLELGFPLTALYPAAAAVYRKVGYEFVGARNRCTFSSAALRGFAGGDVAVRQGGPDDAGTLLSMVATVRSQGRESGPLRWPDQKVREWLEKENSFCYVAHDGFVVYGWHGRDLRVEELVAGSPETMRALWATVASGASIAKRVELFASPDDPVHLLAPEEAEHEMHAERWMLRLLDAPAGIAARGWPTTVEVDRLLHVEDPDIPANAGTWRLQVKDGAGSLTPADGEALTVGARGLACLYGGTTVAALRTAGLAHGGDSDDDTALDAAFAGPTPYCLDYF